MPSSSQNSRYIACTMSAGIPNVRQMKNKKEIPQADDVNKISEFPLGVSKTLSSSENLV